MPGSDAGLPAQGNTDQDALWLMTLGATVLAVVLGAIAWLIMRATRTATRSVSRKVSGDGAGGRRTQQARADAVQAFGLFLGSQRARSIPAHSLDVKQAGPPFAPQANVKPRTPSARKVPSSEQTQWAGPDCKPVKDQNHTQGPFEFAALPPSSTLPPSPESAHTEPVRHPAMTRASLIDVLLSTKLWSETLVTRLLNPASCSALAQACKATRDVVRSNSPRTVTLVSYQGMKDAVWDTQVTKAEEGLTRAYGAASRLVLRVPTPNRAALQAVLCLSEAASRAVTVLDVQQGGGQDGTGTQNGISTSWLQGLPEAFPHLHTLKLNRVCGRLPAPALLPRLSELHVTVIAAAGDAGAPAAGPAHEAPCSVAAVLESITAYTSQVSALHISTDTHAALPWDKLLTAPSSSLRRFSTNEQLTDELLGLLITHAPRLAQLGCAGFGQVSCGGQDERVWSVGEVCGEGPVALDRLPHTQGDVLVLPGRHGSVQCTIGIGGPEGLPRALVQRMTSPHSSPWCFPTPPHITLTLPPKSWRMSEHTLTSSVTHALQQLCPVLPAGSTVALGKAGYSVIPAVTRAVTQTADRFSHVTLIPPPRVGNDKGLAALLQHEPRVAHAALVDLQVTTAHAGVAWPWRSVRVCGDMGLEQVLGLPDPTEGQYDEWAESVVIPSVHEWPPEMLTHLEQRLKHLTFIIHTHPPTHTQATLDGAKMDRCDYRVSDEARAMLRVLRLLRWSPAARTARLSMRLSKWWTTPATIPALRSLPWVTNAILDLTGAYWAPADKGYTQLAFTVPLCYTEWRIACLEVKDYLCKAEHLVEICKGVGAFMGGGFGKRCLKLRVEYAVSALSDEQRSQVEACVDEVGCRDKGFEVVWVCVR